jgi:hypothetical protein
MAAKNKETAVAAPQSTAIAPYDFSGESGAGFENVKSGDLAIPFLAMLQDGSPEVKKTHPHYITKGIPGARAGMIMNTVTREIYNRDVAKDKLTFIPCHYQKAFVEWRKREQKGGIVTTHNDERILLQTKKDEKGRDCLPSGNIIVTTAYIFGLVRGSGGEYQRCVISLTSTQLKKARKWLSIATAIRWDGPQGKYNPPFFAHRYLISAVPESNDQGSWYGWQIDLAGANSEAQLVDEARDMRKIISSGAAQIAPPPADSEVDDIPGQ